MDMKVIQDDGEIAHVVLDGRFDIQGAQEVDPRFDELAKSSKAMVVDLAKVSFLASLGIRTLMLSAKTLIRRGGEMAVCGANESVEKVLRTTGFNEVAGSLPRLSTSAARRPDGKGSAPFRARKHERAEPSQPASRDFPGTVEAASDAEIWVASQASALGLGQEAEFAISLCLEELFLNAVKHGHANRATISMCAEPDGVTVEFADDGAPFDPTSPRPSGSAARPRISTSAATALGSCRNFPAA